ncbi:DUF898 family protein [Scandinavium goeteborgense]|uniref:YjgN family protein n=1 Tax=Scandinavium goeteborgense TaxID=1851514 RepID=UPI0021661ED6|nr:DUF898 family protein [Scandinavium goeteborgense]MCS2152041.1 DUF898 family protein [Scandinavium goeteborgense]
MVGIESDIQDTRHGFVFHGKAGAFFLICLGNFLLSVVTLGIYIPWALVKSRRYIYENMELNGVRFKYSATGGALFCSGLLLILMMIVLSIVCGLISPALSYVPVLIFMVLMPLMVVKGLRYQAMMTSLNNVRFGFNCRSGQAMWALLGVPVLMMAASGIILYLLNLILGQPSSLKGLIVHAFILLVVGLLLLGTINGISYGKWMQLLGKNSRFGTHTFDIEICLTRCVKMCVIAMLILLPFIIVIGRLLAPLYISYTLASGFGKMDNMAQQVLLTLYQKEIAVSYILYFTGMILCATFMMAALRNIFINGLTLANTLRFRSSITFLGLLMQIVVMTLISLMTMGLAYPWAKMRYIRYLANNTVAMGNLDALELTDSDELNDTGFLAVLSRGIVPAIPFI